MIDYEEDWLLKIIFRCHGSVFIRACFYAVPPAILAVLFIFFDDYYPDFRKMTGLLVLDGGKIWGVTTAITFILLGFRTKQAFSRFWEGTSLLHQMRGEWFDTVSNCVSFSTGAKAAREQQVLEFRHTLVRLMSLCHGSALEEISGNGIKLETIDLLGLDLKTLTHVKACYEEHHFNRVEVMLHLIHQLITQALEDGLLKIPPPIASRVYQTISRGFVNLVNARKITNTKFPFPYSQLIAMLSILQLLLTPFLMSSITRNMVLCSLFTFVPLFGIFSLNIVARELEDPFGMDANDLPMPHFQMEMNSCLLMLLHPDADITSCCSTNAVMDYHALVRSVHSLREEEETMCTVGWKVMGLNIKRPSTLDRISHLNVGDHSNRLAMAASPRTIASRNGSKAFGIMKMFSEFGPTRSEVGPIRSEVGQVRSDVGYSASEVSASKSEFSATNSIGRIRLVQVEDQDGIVAGRSAKEKAEIVGKAALAAHETLSVAQKVTRFAQDDRGPGAAAAGSKRQLDELQPLLVKSMMEFNATLERWTQQVEEQVGDLTSSFGALRGISDRMPALSKLSEFDTCEATREHAAPALPSWTAPRGATPPGAGEAVAQPVSCSALRASSFAGGCTASNLKPRLMLEL